MVPEQGASDDVALLALQNTLVGERFSVELPNEPEALAAMRGLLRRWLRHAQGSEQEIAEITTACGEAATKRDRARLGWQRAVRSRPGQWCSTEKWKSQCATTGVWRQPRDGDQGRGLSLMRSLMDSVDVDPGAEGTSVRLRRLLNGAEPGQ